MDYFTLQYINEIDALVYHTVCSICQSMVFVGMVSVAIYLELFHLYQVNLRKVEKTTYPWQNNILVLTSATEGLYILLPGWI